MKKYLFLLMLFGCCLMGGCVKDNPTVIDATVKGRVLEVDSDVGIPNMTVKLVEGDYSGGGFTPVNTTLQSVKTDAQGNYQFSYKRQYNRTYDAIAVNSSPDYNEYTQAVLIPDGSANVINIFLLPFGWLKLHVKNVNPYDNRDEVKFFYGSCYGSKVDSIIYVKVGGSPKTARDIRIWTTKNSVQTYKDASVITPPRDTTLLNIFY